MAFRHITARDKPEQLAARAAAYEAHLYRALEIAYARSWRSRPIIRSVLRNARVEGISLNSDTKAATIIYPVPRFKRTWISIIPWSYFDHWTPTETAVYIASTVRNNLRMTETNSWPKYPPDKRKRPGAT